MEKKFSLKIKKGDTVQITLGKDHGKSGKVLRVLPKESKILVEGVNMYKRHLRKMGQREGGIVDVTKPIDLSNVMFLCQKCKKPTRIGFKIVNSKKVRVCKKCQEVIV